MGPQLKLTSTLYGRHQELAKLEASYNECRSDAGQFVALSGCGGCGKSSLVHAFAEHFHTDTTFATGKFCGHRREPYSAVVDAIYTLCCDSLATTSEGQQELSEALDGVLLDKPVLRAVFPKLYQVVDAADEEDHANTKTSSKASSSAAVKMESSMARLHSSLLSLLKSICKPTRPVILFFDDVQWADQASLDVMCCLADNIRELKGLLLIVAFRSEDVNESHPLVLRLNDMKSNWGGITCLEVLSLDLEATNLFLAGTLQRDFGDTMPLAQVLHHKTGGNPFFLRRAVQSLERHEHLYFSTSSFRWEWRDVRRLSLEMSISDNVVELVASTMKQLPYQTQETLKVASCLGGQFRASVIAEYFRQYPCDIGGEGDNDAEEKDGCSSHVLSMEEHIDEILEIALKEDLLTRRTCSVTYFWSHDRLLQAAYSLIPEGDQRVTTHLHLGMLLKEMYKTRPDHQWMLFLAADQMNRGSSLIADERARIDLARLNLEASKLSSARSAFYPAATLLRKAIDLVDPAIRWKSNNYELCLDIYSSLAEIEFVLGNHEASKQAGDVVVANAKCIGDTFQVQTVLIKSLGAQRRYDDIVKVAHGALSSFGVKLPRHPNIFHVQLEAFRMKRGYETLGFEGVINLPTMIDPAATRQTKLLYLLSFFSGMYGRKNTMAVAALRAIHMSYAKGKNGIMASSFGSYGMFLGMSGKTDEAYKYCDIAIKLFSHFGERHLHAQLLSGLHVAVMPLKRPFHESLEPNMELYRVGIECGDLEYGMIGALWYSVCYLLVGLPLAPLASDLRGFVDQVKSYQLPKTLQQTFQIQYQMVLNLQGKARDDPTVLTGDAMDEHEAVDAFEGRSLWSVQRDIYTARIQLAYIFGDLEVGEEMTTELKAYPTDLVVARKYLRDSFSALVAFALARSKGGKKYRAQGQKLLKDFRRQAKQGSVNAFPVYVFLLAEDGSIDNKDPESVKILYDDAIRTCTRSGLLHLAALASERAAGYFMEMDDESMASVYLSHARDLYYDWGASGKVMQMMEQYGKLLTVTKGTQQSVSLKARERFTEEGSFRLKTFDLDSGDFTKTRSMDS